jgi:hypothetical protein
METPDAPNPAFLPLWARLRGHGHLWHRTSRLSLQGILRDGAIVPNLGQLPQAFGQLKVSYSRHLGAVSLFDFDTEDESKIFEHEWEWGTVLIAKLPGGVVIRIQRNALDQTKLLLPTEITCGDPRLAPLSDEIRQMRMVIPAVEALYTDRIPTAAFNGFLMTAFGDTGGYLFREVESDDDAFRILSQISTDWTAAHERRVMERHARGEYTISEMVESLAARKSGGKVSGKG